MVTCPACIGATGHKPHPDHECSQTDVTNTLIAVLIFRASHQMCYWFRPCAYPCLVLEFGTGVELYYAQEEPATVFALCVISLIGLR